MYRGQSLYLRQRLWMSGAYSCDQIRHRVIPMRARLYIARVKAQPGRTVGVRDPYARWCDTALIRKARSVELSA